MRIDLAMLTVIFAVLALVVGTAGTGEQYRPQYHFSPRQHWTNDPNGLVYFEGEYHLFYQYNPFGDEWGHMSWGHAVTRDLMHWEELPVALREENGVMIFTGSTVIDEHNSSGFCQGGKACMVAVYTGHTPEHDGKPALQTQNIAYSNDRGRTWTKYRGNPVLDLHMTDFRDPKAFWSAARREWVMAVALPNDHKVLFYHSADLKQWEKMSEFGPAGATGGQWECPELFEVPVEAQPGAKRWMLKVGLNPGGLQGGSGEQYFVGQFDGSKFVNENPAALTLWTDYGKDCYCALSYNHLPPDRKEPVAMGWMDNWQYAAKLPTAPPWRGQMTLPRQLALQQTPDGLRLIQKPAIEITRWRGTQHSKALGDLAAMSAWLARSENGLPHSADTEVTVRLGRAERLKMNLGGAVIAYDRANGKLSFDRRHAGDVSFSDKFPALVEAPLRLASDELHLRILVDRNSVELFADHGRVVMTDLLFPAPGPLRLEFESSGGPPARIGVNWWTLRSGS